MIPEHLFKHIILGMPRRMAKLRTGIQNTEKTCSTIYNFTGFLWQEKKSILKWLGDRQLALGHVFVNF